MTRSAASQATATPADSEAAGVVRWGQDRCAWELRSSSAPLLARAALVFRPWRAAEGVRIPPERSWSLASAGSGGAWEATASSGRAFTVRGDANRAVTALEFRALEALVEGPPDVLAFHAALVARDGRGLLILGPNEAGKSTLACGLWHAGFSLLGDDVAIVDGETGEARSAPRRVSLRTSSRGLLGDALFARVAAAPSSEVTADGRLFHPDEVDGRLRPESVHLEACVFLSRRGALAAPGALEALEPAQAALALLPYSNLIRRLDAGVVIEAIAPMATSVPAFDVGRGPLDGMISAVERLIEGRS